MTRLCVVEDDPIMGESLADRFALEGIDAQWYRNAEDAERRLMGEDFGAVVCDIHLPGMPGDELFMRLRQRRAVMPPFVFITGFGDLERAVELLKQGAADYITKPFDLDRLTERVRSLIEGATWVQSKARPIGISAPMQRLEALLERLAPLDAPVLMTGETGTGKEVVARRLHELSGRAPFVAVNCAALVESLAESELFGHERGAFTGAAKTHAGVFEQAAGGTLFLDEIGDMPLLLQAKLLRVLQDRTLVRVGGKTQVSVDTRILLATHQDLEARIREGRFREDLYFRINVVELELPPLRERKEDIPWLANQFLDECAGRLGGRARCLSPDAEQALRDYEWPGNVRELRHTLERACIFAAGECLHAADLFVRPLSGDRAESDRVREQSLQSYLAQCERHYIEQSLASNAGRVTQTAERLGISRKSLWERMKRLGIRRREG